MKADYLTYMMQFETTLPEEIARKIFQPRVMKESDMPSTRYVKMDLTTGPRINDDLIDNGGHF